jgi:D-glycerate 3-kinase
VVGLCGAQGSGKSTLAAALAASLRAAGIITAILSLDDLYLTRTARERQGADVHPLLRTRGVPGTNDVALGLAIFAELDQGRAAALPRFDKASDNRVAETAWGFAPAGTEVLIFEG